MFGCAQSTHSTRLRERETGAVIIMLMTLAQPRLALSPCHSLPDVYASAHKSNESCCKCTFIRSHTSFRKGIQFSTRNYKEEKCWHTQRETKFKTKTGKTEDKKSRIKGGKKNNSLKNNIGRATKQNWNRSGSCLCFVWKEPDHKSASYGRCVGLRQSNRIAQ